MTIRDLLNRIEKEKPNSFTEADLIAFLNEVEAQVADELRIKEADVPVYEYGHDEDLDNILLVPAPYDVLYISYLKAKIDYANEEYDSYTNNQAQHVQDYKDFVDWVVREKKTTEACRTTRFMNVW